MSVIRAKGYAATTVDDLCAAAGVTKGAFFHHFKSKEELGVAAAKYWSEITGALFAAAPYHQHADPLERVLGYIDFRKSLLIGRVPEFTCLAGTMVQELYDTSPVIREAAGPRSAITRKRSQPTSPKPCVSAACASIGRRKAPPFIRKPFCKARSSWPRPKAAPISLPRVSIIICAATSNFC